MKRLILITFLYLIINSSFSQNEKGSIIDKGVEIEYPRYQTIVENFYYLYGDYKQVKESLELNFEKRKEGWVVVLDNSEKKDKKMIFWNSEKLTYQHLPILSVKEENISQLHEQLGQLDRSFLKDLLKEKYFDKLKGHFTYNNVTYYDITPYYGYNGYAKDVISLLENEKKLNDTSYYVLGRAYDFYANNLVSASWGLGDSTVLYNLSFGRNSMTKEQVTEYNSYIDKAIKAYSKARKLNPNLKVTVGSINTKIGNTYVDNYLQILKKQNEEEALKRLNKGIFNNAWINIAKNYLNSCDSNAILITYGDNDTYPLLYVQAMLGIRKDVQVINYSLLLDQDYFYHIIDFSKYQCRIKSSFSEEDLKKKFFFSYGKNKGLEYKFFRGTSYDTSVIKNMKDYIDENITENLSIITKNNERINFKAKGSYLLKGDLFLLDMIVSNYDYRPICFSSSYIQGVCADLTDYVEMKGYVHQLNFERGRASYYDRVNLSKSYQNLIVKTNLDDFNESLIEDRNIFRSVRVGFFTLAQAYANIEYYDSVKIVLDFAQKTLPNNKCYYGDLGVAIAGLYFKIKDKKQGVTLLTIVLNNIKENKDIYNSPFSPYDEDTTREDLLSYIIQVAEKYNQEEIIARAKMLLN